MRFEKYSEDDYEAVCDDNTDEIKELQKQEFSAIDQSESIMELDLAGEFMAKLPEGLSYFRVSLHTL